MNEGPYPFVSWMISDRRADHGLDTAASRIQEFFSARNEGAESEIAWLTSYFGFGGMEELPDASIIHDIIMRELLSEKKEVISCPACGKLFIDQGATDVPLVYKPQARSDHRDSG